MAFTKIWGLLDMLKLHCNTFHLKNTVSPFLLSKVPSPHAFRRYIYIYIFFKSPSHKYPDSLMQASTLGYSVGN